MCSREKNPVSDIVVKNNMVPERALDMRFRSLGRFLSDGDLEVGAGMEISLAGGADERSAGCPASEEYL